MNENQSLSRRFTVGFGRAKYRLAVESYVRGDKLYLSAVDITNSDQRSDFQSAVRVDLQSGDMSTSDDFGEALFVAHSGNTGALGAVAGKIGSNAFGGALGSLGAFARTMVVGAISMAFSSIYGFALAVALTITFGMLLLGFGAILLGVAMLFGLVVLLASVSRSRAMKSCVADKGDFFHQVTLNLADLFENEEGETADKLQEGLKLPMVLPVHNAVWLGGLTFGVLTGSKEDPYTVSVKLTTACAASREDRRQRKPIETLLTNALESTVELSGPVWSDGGIHVRARLCVDGEDLGVLLIKAGLAMPLDDKELAHVLQLDLPEHDFLAEIAPVSRLAADEAMREKRGIWADAIGGSQSSAGPPDIGQLRA